MEITKQQQNKFTIFNGAKYFSSGIFQNYLVWIPGSTTQIDSWKSSGISEKNIENKTKSKINFAPAFVDHHVLPDVNSNGHYLINIIYISKKVLSICISYMLNPWLRNLNIDFTLNNCKAR